MSGRRLLGLLLAAGLLAAAAPAEPGIKIATWNLEWLTARPAGDPALPDDAKPKQDADIAVLAGYASQLDAAAVALEEVDGPALAARIFPPPHYRILITGDQDVVQRVALAVRQDIPVVQHPDVAALDVSLPGHRHLRTGLDATLTLHGIAVRVLAVHLKSGCWEDPLTDSVKGACRALTAQLPVLEAWIAARKAEGVPFLVLGDFNRRLKADDLFLAGMEGTAPLALATAGRASPCWGGEDFIDHILAGGAAAQWMLPQTLRVLVYRETAPEMKERLSDHCPVSVRFAVP